VASAPLTARDAALLREIALRGPLPVDALTEHFPSRQAAYVRLGALARRGLIEPAWVAGSRVWTATPQGRRALGLSPGRSAAAPGPRRLARARLILLMARLGYRPTGRLRRTVPSSALWFRRGDRVVVACVIGRRVTASQAARLADRMGLHRNTVHALLILEPRGGRPRALDLPLRPPIVIVPDGAPPTAIPLP
jgi:hypothetical protein